MAGVRCQQTANNMCMSRQAHASSTRVVNVDTRMLMLINVEKVGGYKLIEHPHPAGREGGHSAAI
jgi:hypothetical protein